MVKSQLIDLLQRFAPHELREFQVFVASPYFNRSHYFNELQALLAFIIRASPDFSEDKLDKTGAYEAVFSGSTVVEGKIDKVMSELHKLAREFIQVHTYAKEKNEFQQMLDLAAFYRENGMDNRYQSIVSRLEEQQKQISQLDLDFFRRQFLLDCEQHAYEDKYNRKRDDIHIQKTLQSLDLYYFMLKTELLNQYLVQQKVTLLDIPEEILQAIKESRLPERYEETYPVLMISYQIFRLLEKEQPDISEFENLLRFLRLHEATIHPELLKSYYRCIRNFCVLLVNGGRNDLLPMLFEFQKEHYERGYMHHDDRIMPTTLLSVSNTALKLKELEWAERFVTIHKNRIIGDNESGDCYHLALANYLFHTGAFEEALDTLPQVFQDLDFHLFSRRLELKIYYELNSDLLPFKIDAFKMYLSRASHKVLSAQTKDRNAHFVNLLLQLSGTAPNDKTRARRLIERINEKQTVADREWLLEKAAGLA